MEKLFRTVDVRNFLDFFKETHFTTAGSVRKEASHSWTADVIWNLELVDASVARWIHVDRQSLKQ